jgi:hypothetical protein
MSGVPYGYCQCGCGKKTRVASKTCTAWGYIKGQPVRFIRGHHNRGKGKNGEENSNWKGGKTSLERYPATHMPGHPRANSYGYVRDHILAAEKALGKPLPPKAVVHHVNGTKNSGPLVICQDEAYHKLLHQRMRALRACGHANYRRCRSVCRKWDNPINLYISGNNVYHRSCMNQYNADRHKLKSR